MQHFVTILNFHKLLLSSCCIDWKKHQAQIHLIISELKAWWDPPPRGVGQRGLMLKSAAARAGRLQPLAQVWSWALGWPGKLGKSRPVTCSRILGRDQN